MSQQELTRKFPVKPWEESEVPAEIYYPRGMLGPEERRMLYWLASAYYRGEGVIVDAGAFAGASAFSLAAGLARSPFASSPHASVFSYDLFRAQDAYVVRAISNDFHKIQLGDSYADVFRYQTAFYSDRIVMREGDFLAAERVTAPIEILFIDIAKTPQLNRCVIECYMPNLISGRSVVVQQDYYHCWHPYMQIAMEALSDYFELLDPLVINQSRLWLLRKPIPEAVLAKASDPQMPVRLGVEYLDRAIAKDAGETKEMLKVAKLWYLVWRKQFAEAAIWSDELAVDASESSAVLWKRHLALVRSRIAVVQSSIPA